SPRSGARARTKVHATIFRGEREYGTNGNNGTDGKKPELGLNDLPSIPLFLFIPYSPLLHPSKNQSEEQE
ncbi:MAG: hypothetical protein ABI977_16480, partial [Acidobacteriota bacterium]